MIKSRIGMMGIAFVMQCLGVCVTPSIFAITYSNGVEQECDLLNSTIATYPQPYDRTTIGIGEEVCLALANYSDTDTADDGITQWPVDDPYIGSVEWEIVGAGTLNTYEGTVVEYYAPLSNTDTSATITATIYDSGNYAHEHITRTVTFDILIPSGIEAYWIWDEPWGIKGPPNNWIGGASEFQCIILPYTVNFSRVSFRENITEQPFDWPDGIDTYIPPRGPDGKIYFSVTDDCLWGLNVISSNVTYDHINAEVWDIEYLYDGNGYQDCDFDVIVPNEFLDDNQDWILFETEHHIRHYSGLSCQIEDIGSLFPPEEGFPMGPYR